MTRTLALLLVALAAIPARAQAPARPSAPPVDDDLLALPTAMEALVSSWSEGLDAINEIALSLDAYSGLPGGHRAGTRQSLALDAAAAVGGLSETMRFSLSSDGIDREAVVALFERGYDLVNVLGLVALEASTGRADGAEPDWAAHAAAIREQVAQIRPALAALGIAAP